MDDEYDIIFAGGGTAACIIAGRISTSAPHLKILLLESGSHTKDKTEHVQPGRYFLHLAPGSTTTQVYKAKPNSHTLGRAVSVPTARCVGGGSAVNFMIYNRPSCSDFDDWETLHGNAGWGSKNLIPLLEKAETYEIDPKGFRHGDSGPLKVAFRSPILPIAQAFHDAGLKFAGNRTYGLDCNTLDEDSINQFYKVPKFISSDGRRSDAAHHYLYNNQTNNPNLVVLAGSLVKRVLFEGTRAVGVEFVQDAHASTTASLCTVRAKRLVVISAGALGSPLILERSGIGAKSLLDHAGVKTLVNLPGVGAEYQDHNIYFAPYIVHSDTLTHDGLFRGDAAEWGEWSRKWAADGSGLLGTNGGADVAIKLRPTDDEVHELGPAFKDRWETFFKDRPDKPVLWMTVMSGAARVAPTVPDLKFLAAGGFLCYPASKGHIHITSDDPLKPANLETGYLSDTSDLAALRWSYKKLRELVTRFPMYLAPFKPAHPAFKPGSPAAFNETPGPVPDDNPPIVYSAEDDEAIDENVRKTIETSWHSLGTCPMKARDKGGVVDSFLNVYGVTGLKVADLSIAPNNVSSNTYSAVIAIAEKAALIIANELGLAI